MIRIFCWGAMAHHGKSPRFLGTALMSNPRRVTLLAARWNLEWARQPSSWRIPATISFPYEKPPEMKPGLILIRDLGDHMSGISCTYVYIYIFIFIFIYLFTSCQGTGSSVHLVFFFGQVIDLQCKHRN